MRKQQNCNIAFNCMTIHPESIVTIKKLERDLYALKRRVNLVVNIIEMKMERRLSEKWDFWLTLFYNSLQRIEALPYLISEKDFPESHYRINYRARYDLAYFRKQFADFDQRARKLQADAELLNNMSDIIPHCWTICARALIGMTGCTILKVRAKTCNMHYMHSAIRSRSIFFEFRNEQL